MRILHIPTLLLFTLHAYGQTPGWQWAGKFTAAEANDVGNAVASDASGNIYLTGTFKSPALTWGAFTVQNNGPSGTSDIVLAKFDPNGTLLWAKSFGSVGDETADDICITSEGNILLAGHFLSASLPIGNITLSNSSGTNLTDVLVAELDPFGDEVWAKAYGGTWSETAGGIATDASGNIFITGSFTGSSTDFGGFTLSSVGNSDMFVAKLSSTGDVQWVSGHGGTSGDGATGVVVDASGNVLICGHNATMPITFGSNVLNVDVFLVKFDTDGNVLWAKGGVASDNDIVYAMDLTIDQGGNAVMAGTFASPTITFDNITLNSAGDYDIFIAKYGPTGDPLWANAIGSDKDDGPWDIVTGEQDRITVAGYFKSNSIAFGSHVLNNSNTYGMNDIYVASMDGNGNYLWAAGAGGGASDRVYGMCVHDDGGLIVTGYANNEAAFGNDTLWGYTDDIFIAKLIDGTSGIGDGSVADAMVVYPVPATDEVRISFPEHLLRSPLRLELVNMLGGVITSLSTTSHTTSFSVDDLPSGIYLMRATGQGLIAQRKLTITH